MAELEVLVHQNLAEKLKVIESRKLEQYSLASEVLVELVGKYVDKNLKESDNNEVSKICLALVQKWKVYHINAYLCQAVFPIIGYVTTKWLNGRAVLLGEKITREEGGKILGKQVNEHASTIKRYH